MNSAVKYRWWLFSQMSDSIGRRVVEIGSGIGCYTELLLDKEQVMCIEINPEAVSLLREKFTPYPNIEVIEGDIAHSGILSLTNSHFDTAICFNVLEHIQNDAKALLNIRRLLEPGGKCLLIVPALPFLFGFMDRSLQHHRRYSRTSLESMLHHSGFIVEKITYMNFIGVFGWFWYNRLNRTLNENRTQILFFDKFIVPLASRIERIIPPPIGLSLSCIAVNPP